MRILILCCNCRYLETYRRSGMEVGRMNRKIYVVPEPVLREIARPVEKISKRIRNLLKDMAETMYAHNGAGLAAPQLGISERIIVVDVGVGLLSLVNPVRVASTGKRRDVEGCLRNPGKCRDETTAEEVTVDGLERNGRVKRVKAQGLLAGAQQHEKGHLNGSLSIDYQLDGEE